MQNNVAVGRIFSDGPADIFSSLVRCGKRCCHLYFANTSYFVLQKTTSRRGGAGAPLRNSKGNIVARPPKPKPTQTPGVKLHLNGSLSL